jgi:hypothetical protein
MERGFDAMIFIAIIALFYAVYRLYIKANETEQEITEIVRQIALRLDVYPVRRPHRASRPMSTTDKYSVHTRAKIQGIQPSNGVKKGKKRKKISN